MIFPKYFSREDIEQRLKPANQRNIPMFIKTKDTPSTYRQVCRVRLTVDGFNGSIPNASPWDTDVIGTELIIAHEQIRLDLSPLDRDVSTPTDIILQCKKHVETLPPAIAGQGGTATTRHVANVIFHDFALDEVDAWIALLEYNTRCRPCWSVAELRRFLDIAMKVPPKERPRGALRNKYVVETFDNGK